MQKSTRGNNSKNTYARVMDHVHCTDSLHVLSIYEVSLAVVDYVLSSRQFERKQKSTKGNNSKRNFAKSYAPCALHSRAS